MAGGLTNLSSQGLSYGRGLTTLPYIVEPDSAGFAGAGSLSVTVLRAQRAAATFGGAGGLTVNATKSP